MKVVIVGGGFGGIKTALLLSENPEFEVKLVSKISNFEYNAALYRSATGRSPREVVIPLDSIFANSSNVEVIHEEITRLEPQQKLVTSETGESFRYDVLVLAMGQVINDYGISGIANNSYSLDTVANTIELREHIRDVVTKSTKQEPHFAIVGGGASGVELAAELNKFSQKIAEKYGSQSKRFKVSIIEGSDTLLPLLSKKIGKKTEQRLKKLGVDVKTGVMVKAATDDSLSLSDERLAVDTIVWTAGNKNNPFFEKHKHLFHIAKNSRVQVDEYLQGRTDVYVIGDSADTQYSGMAQTALHQANFVAQDLAARLKSSKRTPYKPKTPVYVVPVGPNYAVLQTKRLKIWGYFAWLLRRAADFRLFKDFQPFKDAVYSWRKGNDSATHY